MKRIALVFFVLAACTLSAQAQNKPVLMWKLLPNEEVRSCAVSPDNKIVAAPGKSKVFLWKIATGEALESLRGGHEGEVAQLVFSPDSKQLAIGGEDATIRIWDISTSQEVRKLEGHKEEITSMLFSKDGKQLVTGSVDKTIRIWNLDDGKLVRTIEGLTFPAIQLALKNEGKLLVSIGATKGSYWDDDRAEYTEVSQWDTDSGELQQTVTLTGFTSPLCLGSDGETLVGIGRVPASRTNPDVTRQRIRIYKIAKGEFFETPDSISGEYNFRTPQSMRLADNLKFLAIASDYGISFWGGSADEKISTTTGWIGVTSFELCADNRTFALTNSEFEVHIWRFP